MAAKATKKSEQASKKAQEEARTHRASAQHNVRQGMEPAGRFVIVMVKYASVNYAVRFGGSVTTSPACRVRYGVGPDLIYQSGPSPGIKTNSPPAAFPTTLSLPFVPFPLSHLPAPPLRASGRAELHLLPYQVLSPHRTDTTGPVEDKVSVRRRCGCRGQRLTRNSCGGYRGEQRPATRRSQFSSITA